jgi:hypothetical protein
MTVKLTPRNQSESDHVAHVLSALHDIGAGEFDWTEVVDFAVRSCRRGRSTHQTYMAWLRAHPVVMQRAYTETQHEEGRSG